MEEVVEKSRKAKEASLKLGVAPTPVKNAALERWLNTLRGAWKK
jgi:gamma-glutamyl phosphate reductase